jgi:hypothetical protein
MRTPILSFLSVALLMACSNPPEKIEDSPEGVEDILLKMKSIDEDTSLLVNKRNGSDSNFDSLVEIHHSKNGRLFKYETRLHFRDTSAKLMIYADNDSVIYSENIAIYKTDTLWYSKLYFRHGSCVRADETKKTDPDFTFSAGQNFIEAFKK